jgi:hypothetical protein
VSHPYHLPGNINLFQFSFPYLAEKVVEMLYNVVRQGVEDEKEGKEADMAALLSKKKEGGGSNKLK